MILWYGVIQIVKSKEIHHQKLMNKIINKELKVKRKNKINRRKLIKKNQKSKKINNKVNKNKMNKINKS